MFAWLKRRTKPRRDKARDATIAGWAQAQLAPWQTSNLRAAALDAELDAWNTAHRDIYLFDFAAGRVSLREKPATTDPHNRAEYSRRASLYHDFFQTVLDAAALRPAGTLAMSLEDYRLGTMPAPLGTFQRRIGDPYLLFPDVDALTKNFYADEPADPHAYAEKRAKAIFAGSTTGAEHTLASVAQLSAQRLRSGVFFRNSEDVYFRLPTIVQCVDKETEQAIRALGFGHGRADWAEHLNHKFLISIDGNGATCSRVALALRSQSALLKYRSDYELYYFPGLRDSENYLSITRDEDILDIVHAERRTPGHYAEVARAGTTFFETYLTRDPAIVYTADVLRAYFTLFYAKSAPAVPTRSGGFPLTVTLHVAGIGDVVADPANWAGPINHPIEGFTLAAKEFFAPFALEYAALEAAGQTPWQPAGSFVGTFGQSRALLGFAVRLARGGQDWRVVYYGRFANGELVGPIEDGAACQSATATPLEGLRVAVERVTPAASARRPGAT